MSTGAPLLALVQPLFVYLQTLLAYLRTAISFVVSLCSFKTFLAWLTQLTSSFPLPPLIYIVAALILSTAFTCLVAETVIGWTTGLLLWKLGITKSWSTVEFRALKCEVKIDNFELAPYTIAHAYSYWKRIFPVELLYAESSVIRLKLDVFRFELKVTVIDLAVCFRITHQNQWNHDLTWAREIAYGYKYRMVNHFSDILFNNISTEPAVGFLQLKLDEMAHRVYVEMENMDLRFVDDEINYSFGMKVAKLNVSPANRNTADPDAIGAVPKVMKGINTRIYGSPVAKLRADDTDEDNFFVADLIDGNLYVPDLHSCLLQPGFTPYGKGKRLMFTAKVNKAELNVHEKQAEMVWFHFLRAFGFYEFRPWKYRLNDELQKYEREPTFDEERKYIPLYRRLHFEKKASEIDRLTTEIQKIEYFLKISSIMRLRRLALGIVFADTECHSQHRQDSMLRFDSNSEPQDILMSYVLAMKRPSYEDTWCRPWFLHEIYLKELITSNLIIRVYDKENVAGNPGLPVHGGALKTLYDISEWTGQLRYLFHERPDGLCQGALREICEPDYKMLDIRFGHVSCKVINMDITNKTVFRCLLENRKRTRLRNVRHTFNRYPTSKGFQFLYQLDSQYRVNVDFYFAKVIVPCALSKELDDTNAIVYRGFWGNAINPDIIVPRDLCLGANLSASNDIFPLVDPSVRKEGELLLFSGRNVMIKLKIDGLDLLLFENLYSLESKCQRVQGNIALELNTGKDFVKVVFFADFLRIKQWYPEANFQGRINLPFTYSKFLDANCSHSVQSSPLLELDKVQLVVKKKVSEGDNSYLKTLCSDHWNGEYERLSLSIRISVDPNSIDHGTTNVLGYKMLESLRLTLSFEGVSRDFNLPLQGMSCVFDTDVRIRRQSDRQTVFLFNVTGIYIDPERGVDMIHLGAVSFPTPIASVLTSDLKNSDGLTTGSIRVFAEVGMPLMSCSLVHIQTVSTEGNTGLYAFPDIDDEESRLFLTISVPSSSSAKKVEDSDRRTYKTEIRAMTTETDISKTFLLPVEPGGENLIRFSLSVESKETGNPTTLGMCEIVFDGRPINGLAPLRNSNQLFLAEISYNMQWVDLDDVYVPNFNLRNEIEIASESPISFRCIRKDVDIYLAALKAIEDYRMCKPEDTSDTSSVSSNRSSRHNTLRNSSDVRIPTAVSSISAFGSRYDQFNFLRCRHEGKIQPVCGDFHGQTIARQILGHHATLAIAIANSSPKEQLLELWEVLYRCLANIASKKFSMSSDYLHMSSFEKRKYGDQTHLYLDGKNIKAIQMDLVHSLQNYSFAYDAWGFLFVPALLGMPKLGNFRVHSGKLYTQIYGLISVGSHLYIDTSTAITAIDDGLKNTPLLGIQTAKSDKVNSGSKIFEFDVSGPCIIFLCFDVRCQAIPRWVERKSFKLTHYRIQTSESYHVIYSKRLYGADTIALGGCSCSLRDANNYFVLLSKVKSSSDSLFEAGTSGSGFGFKFRGSMIRPVLAKGVRPTWQLRQSTLLKSNSFDSYGNLSKIDSFSNIQSSTSSFDQSLDQRVSSESHGLIGDISPFQDVFVYTELTLSLPSGVSISFPENSSRSSYLVLQIQHIEMFSSMMSEYNSHFLSDNSRISAAFHCVLRGEFLTTDENSIELYNGPFLHDWSITVDISKNQGDSLLTAEAYDESQLKINFTPQQLIILIESIRNIKSQNKFDILSNNQDNKERLEDFPSSCMVDVLLLNKLGQDATLWLNYVNRSRVLKKEELLFSDGALIRLQIPSVYLDDDDQNCYVEANFSTTDWTPVRKIRLTIRNSSSFLFGMNPNYTDNSFKVESSSIQEMNSGQVRDVLDLTADELWAYETTGSMPDWSRLHSFHSSHLDHPKPQSITPISSAKYIRRQSFAGKAEKAEKAENNDFKTPKRKINIVEGNVSINPIVLRENEAEKGPFALVVECQHKSKDDFLRELGVGRLSGRFRSPSDEIPIDPNGFADFVEDDDISERLTSIIESTIIASKENKAIVLSFSGNIFLKNSSADTVSVLYGDRKISEPLDPSETSLYALPLESLSSGHVLIDKRCAFDVSSDVGNVDSICIRQEALDPLIPNALRRSTEYEIKSFILRPDPFEMEKPSSLKTSSSVYSLSSFASQTKMAELPVGNMSEIEKISDALESVQAPKPLKWNLVMLPAVTFVNALPCSIEIELVQPPFESSAGDRSSYVDGAFELFFLPDEFAAKTTLADETLLVEDWRPFCSQRKVRQMTKVLNSGPIKGGDKFDLASVHTDRPIYFRVRVQGSELWSKVLSISRVFLNNRKKYNKHTPKPVQWDDRSKETIEFSMKLSWKPESNRAVEFFSSYWVINKSGLSLRYRKVDEELSSSSSKVDSIKKEISDSTHINRVGSQSIPVILNSSSHHLQFLPYDLISNVSKDQFYLFNVKSIVEKLKFRVCRGLRREREKPVFVDDGSYVIAQWPDCILSLESYSRQSCIIKTAIKDASLSEQEVISFCISHDAYVDICVDSRYTSPPTWVTRLGFRRQERNKVLTNHPLLTFSVFRKFYKSSEIVKLGGNSHGRDNRVVYTSYFVVVSKYKGPHGEPSVCRFCVSNQNGFFSRSEQYQLMPWFSVGDKLYVDRDITCFSLPSTLKSISILAIQTCNDDVDLHNEEILEFELQQPSYVLLCIDCKLSRALPFWIRQLGFRKIDNFNIHGDKDGSIKFDVFSKCYSDCENFQVILNGLGKSKKDNNYFVLIVNEADFASSCTGTYTVSSPLHMINDDEIDVEGIVRSSCNLNSFWNEEFLGNLVHQSFVLDPYGLRWSEPYRLEHGDRDIVMASNCLLSVSVSRLPGIFSRTCAVMLLPRYICCNKLGVSIVILPHAEFYDKKEYSGVDLNPVNIREGAKVQLDPFESGVIYNFGENTSDKSNTIKRMLTICYGSDKDQVSRVFSKPINCDDLSIGEQYIWMTCSASTQDYILVLAHLIMEGSTTMIYLYDSSVNPPYRIENRTSSFTLKFRQHDSDEQWVSLPPHTWKSYALFNMSRSKQIEVSVDDSSAIQPKVFNLDEIYSYSYFSLKRGPCEYENCIAGSTTVDGLTRVISFYEISAKLPVARQFQRHQQSSVLLQTNTQSSDIITHKLISILKFKSHFNGVELNLLDSNRNDFLSIYVDKVHLQYHGTKSSIFFSVFHVNVDDMRARAKTKFSVVLSPRDSGLNSHLQETACEKPWLSIKCNWNPASTRVTHIHSLDVEICPLEVKIDGDLLFSALDMIGNSFASSDEDKIILSSSRIPTKKLQEVFMNAARDILLFEFKDSILQSQLDSAKIPIFVESLIHNQVIVYFELFLGQPDPSVATSASVLKFMPKVIGSIIHSSPTISFKERKIENYFGDLNHIITPIAASFQQQATVQCYKVFGSLDVIGDPLSLFGDIGTGFERFLQKTEDEIVSFDLKGEGVKDLFYSVTGGIFNSISKISGSVANIVSATTGTTRAYEIAAESGGETSTSSQAASILVRSVVNGFSDLIDEPGRGFSREGSLGAVKGIFKGLFSVIATPVAGTLDAVSVVTDSVSTSLQLHGKPVGRRRNPN